MKFLELISAFRYETHILDIVLQDPKWKQYKAHYEAVNSLVIDQNRKVLDEEIPFDLGYEVCEKSKLKFWLYYLMKPQVLSSRQQKTEEEFEEISALDVWIRFGGTVMEDALEKGSSEVISRKLNGKAETINVFNLTNIGMLAFIRTEDNLDITGKELTTIDGQKKWLVLKRLVMFVHPVSAYQKMKSQEAQGIFQYLIKPGVGQYRPAPSEILIII